MTAALYIAALIPTISQCVENTNRIIASPTCHFVLLFLSIFLWTMHQTILLS